MQVMIYLCNYYRKNLKKLFISKSTIFTLIMFCYKYIKYCDATMTENLIKRLFKKTHTD